MGFPLHNSEFFLAESINSVRLLRRPAMRDPWSCTHSRVAGLAKLIQMRHEVRPYWVHVIWTINVVVFVLAIWWGMFYWRGLWEWSAEWFYFMATYAILQFMWASMLYPPEFPAGLNCEDYFLRTGIGSDERGRESACPNSTPS
jgi:hypothetical protein